MRISFPVSLLHKRAPWFHRVSPVEFKLFLLLPDVFVGFRTDPAFHQVYWLPLLSLWNLPGEVYWSAAVTFLGTDCPEY